MNKNLLIGFNIVLLVLVGVLFYLHFSSSPAKSAAATTNSSTVTKQGSFTIAYFEMDSIENNYEYLKDVRNELKGKEQQLTSQLNAMKKSYLDKVNKFQQEAQKHVAGKAGCHAAGFDAGAKGYSK